MAVREPEWRIDRSSTVELDPGDPVRPSRTSLWLLVRSGAVSIGDGVRLAPGDAAYLHHALLHPIRALASSTVLLADLRHRDPGFTPEVMVVPGFAARQGGVVALLSACPVTGQMRAERPTITAAYGELLGSAMVTELGHAHPAGLHAHGDEVVRRATRALARDLLRPWSLTDLASQAHVSTTTLVDRFRAALGLTPMQLLRRLRLRHAMDELTSTEAPLATIAHRSGYGSAEAFVRAFRAETGCTPGRWRQSSRTASLIEANPIAATAAATAPTAMVVQTSA